MKRRREQERDDAIAREQADARREALLAELKAREAASREPEPEPAPEPSSTEEAPADDEVESPAPDDSAG